MEVSVKYRIFAAEKRKRKRIMCTYNVKIEDRVVERVKPHFSGDKALKVWIEKVLKKAMEDFAEQSEAKIRKDMASQLLVQRLESLKDDPEGFFKMGGILGSSQDNHTWEQLREEAIFDKYGI